MAITLPPARIPGYDGTERLLLIQATSSPGSIRSVGPELGEHTNAILREVLGLADVALDQLRADGVIA